MEHSKLPASVKPEDVINRIFDALEEALADDDTVRQDELEIELGKHARAHVLSVQLARIAARHSARDRVA